MNQARALQVLNDIYRSVSAIESECERLCLLINECRDNQYWKLQYTSEAQWGLSVFNSISSFRHLASISDAYRGNMHLISELGRNRAEILIPVMRKEGNISEGWHQKANKLTLDQLQGSVREQYPSRRDPKTEKALLMLDIRRLKDRISFYERSISVAQEKLKSKEIQLSKLIKSGLAEKAS